MTSEQTPPQINVLDVRDVAIQAITEIKHHAIECDKRQIRIEKAQDDLKAQIAAIDTKVTTAAAGLLLRVDAIKEATDIRIIASKESTDAKITATREATDSQIMALSDKIGALSYKVAIIVGVLMGAKEGIVALIHHAGP